MVETTRQPLGIGNLIGDSFGLFFRRLPLFAGIAFVPALIVNVISAVAMRGVVEQAASGPSEFAIFTPTYFVVIGLAMLSGFFIMGLLTLAAYDAATNRPARIGAYLGITLRYLIPMVVLGIIFTIAFYVGFLLLVVPGLYIAARFWVMVPAMLVEPAGWGALGRASRLSKGYRWPMVGALIVIVIMLIILSLIINAVAGLLLFGSMTGALSPENSAELLAPSGGAMIISAVLQAIGGALTYGLLAIFTALLYARLREIKEGTSVEDLAQVFA